MKLRKAEEFDTCLIGEPGVLVLLATGSYLSLVQSQEIEKLQSNLDVDVFTIEDFPFSYLTEIGINGSPYFIFHHSDYVVLRFAGFLWETGLKKLLDDLLVLDIMQVKREVGELV